MAKRESSVAPKERINVTFKPATGGASEEVELPMKVMVLGDFLQKQDPRPLHERNAVSVGKNNFSDVMASQRLDLSITVPNTLQDDTEDEVPVNLKFNSMRDFEPGSIVEQVPETKKLMQIREALVSLKGPMGNMPAFRKALETVLNDPEQREAVRKELEEAGIMLDIPSKGAKKSKGKAQDKDKE